MDKKTPDQNADNSSHQPSRHQSEEDGTIVSFADARQRHRQPHKLKQRRNDTGKALSAKRTGSGQNPFALWNLGKRCNDSAEKVPFFNLPSIPVLTRALCIAIVVIYALTTFSMDAVQRMDFDMTFGFVPARLTMDLQLASLYTPLTHMFLHGSWAHVFFNAITLLAFGSFFERIYGPRLMGLFLTCGGLAGILLHVIFNPFSAMPVIGASGGISALFGTLMMVLYHGGRLGGKGQYGPVPYSAFWVGILVVSGIISGDNIAWQAHVGGFLAGVGLTEHLRRKGRMRMEIEG